MAVQAKVKNQESIADAIESLPRSAFFLNRAEVGRVERMLGVLAIEPGDRVLHFGASYGWLPAIMARLTGKNGLVVAAKEPQEIGFAQDNCNKFGVDNVKFYDVSNEQAWSEPAPYTKILFDTADQRPDLLKLGSLLSEGGKIVVHSLGIVNRFNPNGTAG